VLVRYAALRRLALLLSLALSWPAAGQETGARTVGPSGLPLPRFASLASSEVNVRTGPSIDHPIRWTYSRTGLPVRIVEESDQWRRIEDPDGETGWAHASLLAIQRRAIVVGPGTQELRRSADPDGRVVALLEPGVIGTYDRCEGEWCRIEVEDELGWVPRSAIWGVAPGE
jgi:SH3-like domain-containing protein